MVTEDTRLAQVVAEYLEEEVALSAAAHARDDLNEVGVAEHERAFQIRGTLDQSSNAVGE